MHYNLCNIGHEFPYFFHRIICPKSDQVNFSLFKHFQMYDIMFDNDSENLSINYLFKKKKKTKNFFKNSKKQGLKLLTLKCDLVHQNQSRIIPVIIVDINY